MWTQKHVVNSAAAIADLVAPGGDGQPNDQFYAAQDAAKKIAEAFPNATAFEVTLGGHERDPNAERPAPNRVTVEVVIDP